MKLSEAIKALEDGKKIRMSSWPKIFYIYYSPEQSSLLDSKGNVWYGLFSTMFLTHNSWELYKETVPGKEAIQLLYEGKRLLSSKNLEYFVLGKIICFRDYEKTATWSTSNSSINDFMNEEFEILKDEN